MNIEMTKDTIEQRPRNNSIPEGAVVIGEDGKRKKGSPGKYANGEPAYHPTEREMEQRIEFAKEIWVNSHSSKHQMAQKIMDKFGVNRRTASIYLTRARDSMAEVTAASWQQKREDAYHRYLQIATDQMQTGEIETNLVRLNEKFNLPHVPDLVERKTKGTEKGTLDQADLSFHEREYERLRRELEKAYECSSLPEYPRQRIAGF